MDFIDSSKKFSEFFDKIDEKRSINHLVLHHIEANSLNHAIEQLKEHKVSSHFIIDEEANIFKLVEEKDIAYHAGFSCWRGVDGINKSSIGIEFINKNAFSSKFKQKQLESGVKLCKYLIEKYQIEAKNIVGHSDIAYCNKNSTLDRKQDPSHLFDWRFFAKNGVGVFPEIEEEKNEVLFSLGDKNQEIIKIKQKLSNFGYKIFNFASEFDIEMKYLVKVFNRRFLNKEEDVWLSSSNKILDKLTDN